MNSQVTTRKPQAIGSRIAMVGLFAIGVMSGCNTLERCWPIQPTSALSEPAVTTVSEPAAAESSVPIAAASDETPRAEDHSDLPTTAIGASVIAEPPQNVERPQYSEQPQQTERFGDSHASSSQSDDDFSDAGDLGEAEALEKTAETPHRRSSRFRPMWVR